MPCRQKVGRARGEICPNLFGRGAAGGQNSWDGHHGIEENLGIHCPEIDRPISALLEDLEQRGLLEETLVVWGGEFGRQPVSETFNTGGKSGGGITTR